MKTGEEEKKKLKKHRKIRIKKKHHLYIFALFMAVKKKDVQKKTSNCAYVSVASVNLLKMTTSHLHRQQMVQF